MAKKSVPIRFFYVGNFHPKSVGEPEIANALEKLGHIVYRQPMSRSDKTFLKTIDWKDYDVFLFSKLQGSIQDHKEVLESIPIPKVCWMFDLYWGYRDEKRIAQNKDQLFYADLVLTTDGGNDDKWKSFGINHKTLRQGIAEDVIEGKPTYPTYAQIGFVGSRMPWAGWNYRPSLLKWLETNYPNFQHFGNDGALRHEELNNLYATLKIVIGDSVHSPNYWSNRLYETIGRGGFLIHPMIEGIEKEFTPYEHFIPYTYGDMEGLQKKIDYYLIHDEDRERIRKAGFIHCHKYHTYTHRVKDLLKILKEEKLC